MSGSREARPRSRLGRLLRRWLGLTAETRVTIEAPGVDVVVTGEPRKVRKLLAVLTRALEADEAAPAPRPRVPASKLVLPTDLDEMDSPYAFPVGAVAADSSGPEDRARKLAGLEPEPEGERTAISPMPEGSAPGPTRGRS